MDSTANIPSSNLLLNQPTMNIIQPNDVNKILLENLIQPTQYLNFISAPVPQLQPNNIPNFINEQKSHMSILPENSHNEKSNETDEVKNPKHVKRRSKTEVEGRTFECKLCSKSYLSYPALYTHYKQKHNTNNSSGRGRGRPKKEENDFLAGKKKYNPLTTEFFAREDRTGVTESTKDINDCIQKAFKLLYENKEEIKKRNEERGMKFYNTIEEHKFLGQFLKDSHDNKRELKELAMTDEVLIDYLNKMSKFCNPKFFAILIIFVTLFREHVNKINADKINKIEYENKEYTEVMNAEDVPDSSNEFITEFLFPEGKENDFGFTKEEAIDMTQNLCYWMYENNFTCSKLSLTHPEKQ